MTEREALTLRPGPHLPESIEIFDTTLRDGTQREGLSLSLHDKFRIARKLDELGVHYIEGGWPGANPKDDEFFRTASQELQLETSQLVAFGSTRRAGKSPEDDPVLANLLQANTRYVCIVGKAWDYHVTEALRTTLDEGLKMVADSVRYLREQGKSVFLDAEHFFDGWKYNRSYALEVLTVAEEAGVECLVLCDTNGGTLPFEVAHIVDDVRSRTTVRIGVHFHNDADCAVANALIAVQYGAEHVQGCINGIGERTGNVNLSSIIPSLAIKLGVKCLDPDQLAKITSVSHAIAEIANITLDSQKPYVGASAFAHKAGLHASALVRRPDAYEHVNPGLVGNSTRMLISELAGSATVVMKAEEMGIDLHGDKHLAKEILDEVKRLEHLGYQFEAADGSFELLVRGATGWQQKFFELESFRLIMEKRQDGQIMTEATVKVLSGGDRHIATAEGNGPVNALDNALRQCIEQHYPELGDLHLTDYKVRVLDAAKATEAVTRVLIDTTDGLTEWSTIGVSENIIEASWRALTDSIVVGLLRAQKRNESATKAQ